jgi:hypothetical protein
MNEERGMMNGQESFFPFIVHHSSFILLIDKSRAGRAPDKQAKRYYERGGPVSSFLEEV